MWNGMGCGTLGIGLSLDALTDTWEDGGRPRLGGCRPAAALQQPVATRVYQRHLDHRSHLTMSKLAMKLKEEFLAMLPPAIFFFVMLQLVALIRALMLKGTGITVSTPLQVTVSALVLGKAVLVADLLPAINRYPDKPLI